MSVYLRKNVWWCNFAIRGKRYQFSTGETVRSKAVEWEKEKIGSLKGESSAVFALEKIRQNLVDRQAGFEEGWQIFVNYPRKTFPNPRLLRYYRSIWNDFSAFCRTRKVEVVAAVDGSTAAHYIGHVRAHGKFGKKSQSISSRTVNCYLEALRLIFRVLTVSRYCVENPFAHIEKLTLEQIEREIYTGEELRLLLDKRDHRLYPVIVIGLYSGLRLRDIVCLKCRDLDLKSRWLRVKQHKTGNPVAIPLVPPLQRFFGDLVLTRPDDFLFPDLAEQYRRCSSQISKDFKALLAECGITETTVVPEGRSRKVSVKDIHSLRHTFAYMAGKYRVPQHIVQSILGHMSPAMTRHYMNHATAGDKQAALLLPDMTGAGDEARPDVVSLLQTADADNWREVIERAIELLTT